MGHLLQHTMYTISDGGQGSATTQEPGLALCATMDDNAAGYRAFAVLAQSVHEHAQPHATLASIAMFGVCIEDLTMQGRQDHLSVLVPCPMCTVDVAGLNDGTTCM